MTSPPDPLAQAFQLHQAGEVRRAEELCRQALGRDPDNGAALHLLGVLAHEAGRTEEAVGWLRRAVGAGPDNAEYSYNLGVALQVLGRAAEAEGSYRHALRLRPADPRALNNLGFALLTRGRCDEARACLEQALRLEPNYPEALNNLGKLHEQQGRAEEACACFREALRLCPNDPVFHSNLGNVLTLLGRPDEALASYEEAVRLHPGEAIYLSNLGNALTLLGRPAEAEARCREAVRLRPDLANAHHNLAIALASQGNLDEAVRFNEEALRLQPDHAGAHTCQALWWIQHGLFERGWREYEWRWRGAQGGRRSFREPTWDGSPLPGRAILLWCEQGLGDTLQFIRYAPLVKQRGATVIVECQPALAPLLSRCPGVDRLVPRGERLPPFDVQAPLLSLPRILGTTLSSVPAEVPYLFADPALVERWRARLARAGGFTAGIAWQGNPRFPGDCLRSVPLRHFAPLARVEGVRLVSLQKGPGAEQLHELADSCPVTDLGELDEAGAFMDTAAVMRCLDLVVTSDTAVAHLAGGLGVPAWVALPLAADWRWLCDRPDSPWYPTMRLFRQHRLGDWGEVFECMAAELRRELAPPPRNAIAVEVAPGELLGSDPAGGKASAAPGAAPEPARRGRPSAS